MKARSSSALGVLLVAFAACETTLVGPPSRGRGTGTEQTEAGAPSLGGAPADAQATNGGEAPLTGGTTSAPPVEGGENDGAAEAGGHGAKNGNGDTSARAGTTGRTDDSAGVPGASGEGGGGAGALASGAGGESGAAVFGAPSRCTSGTYRDPNESEGPEMMPGVACNACHARVNAASGEGDAPIFTFAGTVFPSAHEPDGCVAPDAEGAVVFVRDAAGTELSAVVNGVGNFSLDGAELVPPITARVVQGGRERAMVKPAAHGDCNLCHTVDGAALAPGRIVLP